MNAEGLTTSFDLAEIEASKQLYSMARTLPFWRDGSLTMAYPFGWSSSQFAYDPKAVPVTPTSWEILTDPRMRGRVVRRRISPTISWPSLVSPLKPKVPYHMTDAEIARAKAFLISAKPAFVKTGLAKR